MSTTSTSLDPAQTTPYRLANAGQAAAALVFSLAPLLITATYASVLGFQGDDPLIYRLGGAATLGYAVVALIALVRPKTWDELIDPVARDLHVRARGLRRQPRRAAARSAAADRPVGGRGRRRVHGHRRRAHRARRPPPR